MRGSDRGGDRDAVLINGLEFRCVVGVLPEERTAAQRVVVNAELYTDFAAAAASDDVGDAVNYAEAAALMAETAVRLRARTVEFLAAGLMKALRERFGPNLSGAALEVLKPDILPGAASVGVRMTRFFGRE